MFVFAAHVTVICRKTHRFCASLRNSCSVFALKINHSWEQLQALFFLWHIFLSPSRGVAGIRIAYTSSLITVEW